MFALVKVRFTALSLTMSAVASDRKGLGFKTAARVSRHMTNNYYTSPPHTHTGERSRSDKHISPCLCGAHQKTLCTTIRAASTTPRVATRTRTAVCLCTLSPRSSWRCRRGRRDVAVAVAVAHQTHACRRRLIILLIRTISTCHLSRWTNQTC